MESRQQPNTVSVALIVVIAVTAMMTVTALSSTIMRGNDAYHQVTRDLKLQEHVRRGAQLLADATRRYLNDRTDVQRSRIAQLQRELGPSVDRLATRGVELGAPNCDSLKRDLDRHIAWLSAVAAEHVAMNEFERALASRSIDLETQLKIFAEAADQQGTKTKTKADGLARRAQVGVLITSAIGIALVFVLGVMERRRLRPN